MKLSELRNYEVEGKPVKLKNVILPRHIAGYAKKLTQTNRDCPIIISGYAGEGKSVLGIHLARSYDRKYNHERNLIYSRDEMKNKINTLRPSGLIVDENMNVLYKRDWGTKGQKEIIKLLDICRFKRHMILMIQPTMSAVDTHVRDTRVRLWIYVIKRGLAAVFRPLRQLSYEDPWRLKDNDATIKKYIKKLGEVEGRIEGCHQCENFLAFVRWEDIDNDDYMKYEEVKDKKKDAYEEIKLYTPDEVKKLANEKVFDVISILKYNKKIKMGYLDFISAELDMSKAAISSNIKKSLIKKGLTEVQQFKEILDAPKENFLT